MSFIFISYSRQDQAYVDLLVQALESHDLPLWLDHRIDYGSPWPQEIERACGAVARCFLLVMSPRSKASHWVHCELTRALMRNKPIFPLLLAGEHWFRVGNIQATNVIGNKLPPAEFFERVRAYLPRAARVPQSTAVKVSPYTLRVNRKQFLTWAGFGTGGLALAVAVSPILRLLSSSAPTPNPEATPDPTLLVEPTSEPTIDNDPTPVTLTTSEVEVVMVNETGEIVERQTKQAEYFSENLGNGVMLDMVSISGGEFTMGAPETEAGSDDAERPQRQVTAAPFFMGQYVVTQAQYQTVMAENPSRFTENGANRPVERVSWQDAVAFCEALSERTGRTYRLPSEAEWEYACRAGTEGPFYFGSTITTELANYRGQDWEVLGTTYPGNYGQGPKGTFREETTTLGSFPPNVVVSMICTAMSGSGAKTTGTAVIREPPATAVLG
jgi:formylglycine-generating enzyme required for sulfatase activity